MSNRVKVSQLYDEIREKKTMPNVPLHKMDEISKNLAECLINRTAHERIPYKEWKNQDVMLPILNAENRQNTLHSTQALCSDNIQLHKKIKPNVQKLEMKKQLRDQARQYQSIQLSQMKIDDPSMTQLSLSNNDDYMIKSGLASAFQNSSLKSIVAS